jgi:hypothetical protein
VRYCHVSNDAYISECFPTYANNALGADQLDKLVRGCALGITLGIRLDVSEITNVADLIGGSTVSLAMWVDYRDPLSALSKLVCFSKMCLQWGPAEVQPLVLSPN